MTLTCKTCTWLVRLFLFLFWWIWIRHHSSFPICMGWPWNTAIPLLLYSLLACMTFACDLNLHRDSLVGSLRSISDGWAIYFACAWQIFLTSMLIITSFHSQLSQKRSIRKYFNIKLNNVVGHNFDLFLFFSANFPQRRCNLCSCPVWSILESFLLLLLNLMFCVTRGRIHVGRIGYPPPTLPSRTRPLGAVFWWQDRLPSS